MKRSSVLIRMSLVTLALCLALLLTSCPQLLNWLGGDDTDDDADDDTTTPATVLVTGITISAPNDSFTISTTGGTLQLTATVAPATATDSTVAWTITSGATLAEISSAGLVTAKGDGTVTIQAAAQDASGIKATKDITITNNNATVTLTVTESSSAAVSSSAPVVYQLSADMSFASITASGEISAGEGTLAAQTASVPAGSYYVRAFHDLDDSGTTTAGDILVYSSENSGSGTSDLVFAPSLLTVTAGSSSPVALLLGENPLPENWGMLCIASAYSGDETVDADNKLLVFISDDFSSNANLIGYISTSNNVSALFIVPAGTWYAAVALSDGGAESPTDGYPLVMYNDKPFTASTYDSISVTAGQTTSITIPLTDAYTYEESVTPPPPEDGILTLSITESSDNPVDATHPVIYQLASDPEFTSIGEEGSITTGNEFLDDVTITITGTPSFYIRVFHDLDNNGALSAGDLFTYNSSLSYGGLSSYVFVPSRVSIGPGDDIPVNIDLPSSLPADWGIIKVNGAYTGSLNNGLVDDGHTLNIGFSDATDFSTNNGGVTLSENNQIFFVLGAGTWYVGGFFDEDGNIDPQVPGPDSGDPVLAYEGKAFGGALPLDPISVVSGEITEIDFFITDSFIY